MRLRWKIIMKLPLMFGIYCLGSLGVHGDNLPALAYSANEESGSAIENASTRDTLLFDSLNSNVASRDEYVRYLWDQEKK